MAEALNSLSFSVKQAKRSGKETQLGRNLNYSKGMKTSDFWLKK